MLLKTEARDFRDEIAEDSSEIKNGVEIIWSSRVSLEMERNIYGQNFFSNGT